MAARTRRNASPTPRAGPPRNHACLDLLLLLKNSQKMWIVTVYRVPSITFWEPETRYGRDFISRPVFGDTPSGTRRGGCTSSPGDRKMSRAPPKLELQWGGEGVGIRICKRIWFDSEGTVLARLSGGQGALPLVLLGHMEAVRAIRPGRATVKRPTLLRGQLIRVPKDWIDFVDACQRPPIPLPRPRLPRRSLPNGPRPGARLSYTAAPGVVHL